MIVRFIVQKVSEMRFIKSGTLKMFFLMLLTGCQVFGSNNIDVIVSEDNLRSWELSPTGDKIIYDNYEDNFLLDPLTGQTRKIDCSLRWLDNTHLSCGRSGRLSILDITNDIEIPLTKVNYSEIDLEKILQEVEQIYYPEWLTDTIYVLHTDYRNNLDKNYLITGVNAPTEILSGYVYTFIPSRQPLNKLESQVMSPNKHYYYSSTGESLIIFSAENNAELVQFMADTAEFIEVGGWAFDSSGVYFRLRGVGSHDSFVDSEIRKLTVPSN
ncbi:MAG: hypothetical protein Kow0031_24600 [Anaerolineae bacterium]